jgi:TonB family protein
MLLHLTGCLAVLFAMNARTTEGEVPGLDPLPVATGVHTAIAEADSSSEGSAVEVDQQPTILKKVDPHYPAAALKKGDEGKVWLKLRIDEQGKVAEAEVAKSTDAQFNQPALDAAKQWLFTPAYKGKTPIAIWVTVPFNFKLSADGKKEAKQQCEDAFRAVIRGGDEAKLTELISAGAPLIDGGTLETLLRAAERKDKSKVFAGEAARTCVLERMDVHEREGIAYGLWKTVEAGGAAPRYHTVIFQKSQGGRWMIQEWHTSQ